MRISVKHFRITFTKWFQRTGVYVLYKILVKIVRKVRVKKRSFFLTQREREIRDRITKSYTLFIILSYHFCLYETFL